MDVSVTDFITEHRDLSYSNLDGGLSRADLWLSGYVQKK